jgi:hypothetical protein
LTSGIQANLFTDYEKKVRFQHISELFKNEKKFPSETRAL